MVRGAKSKSAKGVKGAVPTAGNGVHSSNVWTEADEREEREMQVPQYLSPFIAPDADLAPV